MNMKRRGFDLHAMAAPKSIQDLIVMAKEARAELKIIKGYFDAILEEIECPEGA